MDCSVSSVGMLPTEAERFRRREVGAGGSSGATGANIPTEAPLLISKPERTCAERALVPARYFVERSLQMCYLSPRDEATRFFITRYRAGQVSGIFKSSDRSGNCLFQFPRLRGTRWRELDRPSRSRSVTVPQPLVVCYGRLLVRLCSSASNEPNSVQYSGRRIVEPAVL